MAIFSNVKTLVEQVLLNNPQTSQYKIDVVEHNGFVTLMGEVDSTEERKAIEGIVSNLSGVLKVINQLKVLDKH